jgi:hypothetical protein
MSLNLFKRKTDSTDNSADAPRKNNKWLKWAKIAGWSVAGLFIAFIVICSAVVWTLRPERLTPMIEKIASDNLNAQVKVGRAELTFWSSFPRLKVEVDRLEVISHSLNDLPDDVRTTLPANADSLLSVGHFGGGINLFKLIGGQISLSDVLIDQPRINLLQVNDSVANFNIVPPSEPDTVKSPIPDIYIDHFAITNAKPFTYRSMPDSLDVAVTLRTISLDDKGVPLYELEIDTNLDTPLLDEYELNKTRLNLNAGISWSGKDPNRVGIKDLILKHRGLDVVVNTDIDFTDDLRLDALDVKVNNIDVNYIQQHLPPELRQQLGLLHTDMMVNIDAKLLKPLVIADTISTPFVAVGLEVPTCSITYDNSVIDEFTAKIEANYRGDNLDASTIDIKELCVKGHSSDFDLTGQLSNLASDPFLNIEFDGIVSFNDLPDDIHKMLDADLSGQLKANTHIKSYLSNLNADRLQHVHADGSMTLSNVKFKTHDASTGGYVRNSLLTFGTSEKIKTPDGKTDSLLIVKLHIDTASVYADGLQASLRNFKADVGAQNTAAALDTTKISPIGGRVSIGSLNYYSAIDTMRFSLRDAKGRASVQRFKGNAHVPQLNLNLTSDRMHVSGSSFATSLRTTRIEFNAHMNPRHKPTAKNTKTGNKKGPNQRGHALSKEQLDSIGVETVDLDIDNSLRSLIRRWDMDGCITVKKGRLRIPGVNLRNSFSDLDLDFTSDSVSLANLDYRIGRSDLKVNGSLANIKGALSRRHPEPLRIDLNVASDTLNVNQIVQAVTTADADSEQLINNDSWENNEVIAEATDLPTDSMSTILVPVNLDAGFSIKAKNVIYSDMLLHNFRGQLLIYRGALTLRDVSAQTDAGNISVNALYSAPTAKNIEFGLGMKLNNFYIDKVNKMIPGVDSILPMLSYFSGIVNVDVAATTKLQPNMDLDIPSLRAALRFKGDSLVVFDNKTFHTLAKWLLFKDKNRNLIDSLNVEIIVADNNVQIYPFELNIDRYRLGVMGSNDMNLNLNYHVSILKSPLPFKFGINLKGTLDKPKIRFGGAKFKNKNLATTRAIADTTRVNLVSEMRRVFRRGVRAASLGPLDIKGNTSTAYMDEPDDVISHADSLLMIEQGYIEAPDTIKVQTQPTKSKKKRK